MICLTSDRYGIHTIELYWKNMTYSSVQKVIDNLIDRGAIQHIKSDPYNIDRQMKSCFFVGDGLRMRLHQSHNKSNGIGFIINPCSLLAGHYCPVDLWKPTPKAVNLLLERIGNIIKRIGLEELSLADLSLSQMDLTTNIWCKTDDDVQEHIRLFRKGLLPKDFAVLPVKAKELEPYLYIIKNKKITVKVYDKIHELKVNDRCPKKLQDVNILRAEVSLKREAFLKKFDLDRKASLYEMLYTGYRKGLALLDKYLDKMFPFSKAATSYANAVNLIGQRVSNDLLQKQMLFLLRKTSDSAGLSAAVRKLKDQYKDVDNRRIKKIFSEFEKIGVCPITVPKK